MPAWESEPPSARDHGFVEFLGDSVEMLLIPTFVALLFVLATGVPSEGQTVERGVLLVGPPVVAVLFTFVKWFWWQD